MNSGITLNDVRKEAIHTIDQLRKKEIDYKIAGEIRNLLNVIIDTAKVQVQLYSAMPVSIKEKMNTNDLVKIVGAVKSENDALDETLAKLKTDYPIKELERPHADRII